MRERITHVVTTRISPCRFPPPRHPGVVVGARVIEVVIVTDIVTVTAAAAATGPNPGRIPELFVERSREQMLTESVHVVG
jgi:hypothetical protein